MKSMLGAVIGISAVAGLAGWGFWSDAQTFNAKRIHQLKTLKVVKLVAAGHTIDAWVMDNEMKRSEGMMFLTDKEVKPSQGMIFVFGDVQANDRDHSFWMHDTLIPLDIIYISPSKKVVSIANGKRLDETPLPAKEPYKWVVELKAGTCKALGIKPGTVFKIPNLTAVD